MSKIQCPSLPRTLVLAALLAAGVASAQHSASGTVGEVFGRQFTLDAAGGPLLVTLPPAAQPPAPGSVVRVEGRRDGRTIEARSVEAAAPAAASAPAAAAPTAALLPRRAAPSPLLAPRGAVPVPATSLPTVLQELQPAQVHRRHDHGDAETIWSLRLADGSWLRAETHWDGSLKKLRSAEGRPLPDALAARLLPPAIAASPQRREIAVLDEIEVKRHGEIELEGLDRQGARVEIDYTPDGRVLQMERERPEWRRWSAEQVRQRLAQAGYQDIGWLQIGGKHAEAEATNAYGERVEVRLDERGQLARERMLERLPAAAR